MKYSLYDIYPEGITNGYGKVFANQRFRILKRLPKFNSILDVGSGPCYLKEWLTNNFSESINYEAVDIRPETLALCDCVKYTTIPTNKLYDVVCLFGTVTYNIDYDENRNKQILKELLEQSKHITKQIVFTVFKDSTKERVPLKRKNNFVYFSIDEIKNLLQELELKLITVEHCYDPDEYFVICEINNA